MPNTIRGLNLVRHVCKTATFGLHLAGHHEGCNHLAALVMAACHRPYGWHGRSLCITVSLELAREAFDNMLSIARSCMSSIWGKPVLPYGWGHIRNHEFHEV